MKDTDKILATYFQREQRKAESEQLRVRINKKINNKQMFAWRKITFPAVAAMLLLVVGLTLLRHTQEPKNLFLAKKEIIYQDEDLMIYIKEK